MGKISVKNNLPDKGVGAPYMSFMTVPVIMWGMWREDYPIVGHFILETYNNSSGCNVEIPFEHPKGYKFYSARCAYIKDRDVLRRGWSDKLPVVITNAVTHWAYITATTAPPHAKGAAPRPMSNFARSAGGGLFVRQSYPYPDFLDGS